MTVTTFPCGHLNISLIAWRQHEEQGRYSVAGRPLPLHITPGTLVGDVCSQRCMLEQQLHPADVGSCGRRPPGHKSLHNARRRKRTTKPLRGELARGRTAVTSHGPRRAQANLQQPAPEARTTASHPAQAAACITICPMPLPMSKNRSVAVKPHWRNMKSAASSLMEPYLTKEKGGGVGVEVDSWYDSKGAHMSLLGLG